MLMEIAFFMAVVLLEFVAVKVLARHVDYDEWHSLRVEHSALKERVAALEGSAGHQGEWSQRVDSRIDETVNQLGDHEGRLRAIEEE